MATHLCIGIVQFERIRLNFPLRIVENALPIRTVDRQFTPIIYSTRENCQSASGVGQDIVGEESRVVSPVGRYQNPVAILFIVGKHPNVLYPMQTILDHPETLLEIIDKVAIVLICTGYQGTVAAVPVVLEVSLIFEVLRRARVGGFELPEAVVFTVVEVTWSIEEIGNRLPTTQICKSFMTQSS